MAFVDKHMIAAEPRISEATPGDFFALLKPSVMSLVVFTAFVAMAIAPATTNPFIVLVSIAAIAIGAGASGALNMWYDADIDARMGRTAKRPIPAGKVTPDQALAFGLILSAFSVMMLGLAANWLAAAMLAFTIFFYAIVYTMWLKRWTPQNIVIGGAAGAFPPMIGWTAATGSIGIESIALFAIIFLWTPPHFWALALFKTEDYARAGIPMMPNVAGEASTRRQIFVYSILVAISGVVPAIMGFASWGYGAAAAALGAGFVWYALGVLRMADGDRAMKPAKALFGYSLLYLFAIFALVLVDHVIVQAMG
jgi:protoheme IX farnesyltransferase